MALGIEVVVLPSEILAAPVADFSQELSAPDLVLSCGVQWAEQVCSLWERTHCVLLSVLIMAFATHPDHTPGPQGCFCITRLSPLLGPVCPTFST